MEYEKLIVEFVNSNLSNALKIAMIHLRIYRII